MERKRRADTHINEDESAKSSRISSSCFSSPSWEDGLPCDIMESILTLLPLSDYLRFAAVCKQWRSLQSSHRLYFAPSPPPTLPSLPWLIPLSHGEPVRSQCYDPSEARFHHLPLSLIHDGNHEFYKRLDSPSPHGWLFLLSDDRSITLFNPISRLHIHLPSHPTIKKAKEFRSGWKTFACLSTPPTAPGLSDCFVLVIFNGHQILTCRVGDTSWSFLDLNPILNTWTSYVVFCQGKFYCMLLDCRLLALDPAAGNLEASLQVFDMDASLLPDWEDRTVEYLVESEGEIFRVVELAGFQVFRADLG